MSRFSRVSSGAHPRMRTTSLSSAEPPPASRGVIAAQVPPTAENISCLYGQRTGNLVRLCRAGPGRLRPHPQRDRDGRPVRRSWSAAGIAGAGPGSSHRAISSPRTTCLAVPVGGGPDNRPRGLAVALLATRGAGTGHDRRHRGGGGDGAAARLRHARDGRRHDWQASHGPRRAAREAAVEAAQRQASATLNFAFMGALAIGPAIGGALVNSVGGSVALLLDAFTFLVCAGLLARLGTHISRDQRRFDSARLRAVSEHCGPSRRCARCSSPRRSRWSSSHRWSPWRCSIRSPPWTRATSATAC